MLDEEGKREDLHVTWSMENNIHEVIQTAASTPPASPSRFKPTASYNYSPHTSDSLFQSSLAVIGASTGMFKVSQSHSLVFFIITNSPTYLLNHSITNLHDQYSLTHSHAHILIITRTLALT